MSANSDYKVGALSDADYRFLCKREDRRERAYIDEWERYEDEAEEGEGEDEYISDCD